MKRERFLSKYKLQDTLKPINFLDRKISKLKTHGVSRDAKPTAVASVSLPKSHLGAPKATKGPGKSYLKTDVQNFAEESRELHLHHKKGLILTKRENWNSVSDSNYDSSSPHHKTNCDQSSANTWTFSRVYSKETCPETANVGLVGTKYLHNHCDKREDLPPRKLLRTASKPTLSPTQPLNPARPLKKTISSRTLPTASKPNMSVSSHTFNPARPLIKTISSRTLPIHLCSEDFSRETLRTQFLPIVQTENPVISRVKPRKRANHSKSFACHATEKENLPLNNILHKKDNACNTSTSVPSLTMDRSLPAYGSTGFDRIEKWIQDCTMAMSDGTLVYDNESANYDILHLPSISE